MADTALRKELHECLDNIPERNLVILKPLLMEFSKNGREADEWKPIIEPANFWERIQIRWRTRKSEDFVPFKPWPRKPEQ
jgi:hypothetical protein